MSRYDAMTTRRFYRNRDRAIIAGVCAGLADYFGFNLKVTRVLAFISLIMAMPMTLLIYFGIVLLVWRHRSLAGRPFSTRISGEQCVRTPRGQ